MAKRPGSEHSDSQIQSMEEVGEPWQAEQDLSGEGSDDDMSKKPRMDVDLEAEGDDPAIVPPEAYQPIERPAPFSPSGPTTTDGPSGTLFIQQIAIDDLEPHPLNPNEEAPATFNSLTEMLAEDGPDQPLVVVPKKDAPPEGPHYTIIKGEHRWRAARVLGWTHFPSVVREEWADPLTQVTRLVRDNTVRGALNKDKLTEIIQTLRRDHQIDNDMAATLMGFESVKELYKHLSTEARPPKAVDEKAILNKAKDGMKVLDDLTLVLNLLFTRHGSTLPFGYMAFMWGGKISYMIELTDDLKPLIDELADASADRKVDFNLLLAMILRDALPAYRAAWKKAPAPAPPTESV